MTICELINDHSHVVGFRTMKYKGGEPSNIGYELRIMVDGLVEDAQLN